MVTSYHHFLGQLGIVTSPSSQRVRISKVMLVKKPGVGDQGRKGRKENMGTHTREERSVLVQGVERGARTRREEVARRSPGLGKLDPGLVSGCAVPPCAHTQDNI